MFDVFLEDQYRIIRQVDGEKVLLDLLDTAGMEEYSALHEGWIGQVEGYLLVYDITHSRSFVDVANWGDKILKNRKIDKVPMVLVGNKCDRKGERKIEAKHGSALGKSNKNFVLTCNSRTVGLFFL